MSSKLSCEANAHFFTDGAGGGISTNFNCINHHPWFNADYNGFSK
jgi:hypothetical protein